MAKQRGIHQISGTINNLCYYEQKYVKGGLIRRVNEGMSGRLKDDPAFANTRIANREFGMCSIYAKQFLYTLGFRANYMTYPSRQAQLTKKFLRILDQYALESNPRKFIDDRPRFEGMAIEFNSIGKNRSNPLLLEVPYSCYDSLGEVISEFTLSSATLNRLMNEYNCDRIDIDILRDINIPQGGYSGEEGKFSLYGDVTFGTTSSYTFTGTSENIDISLGINSAGVSSVFSLLTVTFLRRTGGNPYGLYKRLESRSLYKLIYTGV